jgi:uncharacterized sporulation protein YeaH/YhbH (DUF444 family)
MFFLLDRRRIGNRIGSVELDPLAPKSGEEKKQEEEEGDEWWKQAWHGGEFLHLLFEHSALPNFFKQEKERKVVVVVVGSFFS